MCGRYAMFGPVSMSPEGKAAIEQMDVDLEAALDQREPQYNVAASQKAPILAHTEGRSILATTRWGLVPSWAKNEKIGSRLLNARAETAVEKPLAAYANRDRAPSYRRARTAPAGRVSLSGYPTHQRKR